ncbi:MAG: V4R domain-containing protein [Candidatus Bathyarchaeia archaeon]
MGIQDLLDRWQAFVFRDVTFSDLKKGLEETFPHAIASDLLTTVGRGCGQRSCSRLMEEHGLKSRPDVLRRIAEIKEEERWGEFDFSEIEFEKLAGKVIVRKSFEARNFGPSKYTVCDFVRGYLSGFLSKLLDQRILIEETKCIARGDGLCEFNLVKVES